MTQTRNDERSGMNRRALLRSAAVGGAVVWAAPAVTTLGRSVAQEGTLELQGCLNCDGDKPSMLRFQYNEGGACTTPPEPTSQGCEGKPPAQTSCSTSPEGSSLEGPVTVTASRAVPPDGSTYTVTTNPVYDEGTFDISNACGGGGGQDFGLGNEMLITLSDDHGTTQTIQIHTSCSSELKKDDTFGAITLLGGVFEC